jgi:hypothetical protein
MAFTYSQTPRMMNRVLLFDSELIEIRAHLFLEDGEETHIHNHGQSFISTCLQGSYVHKLWSIVDEKNSIYYTHSRKPGGVYGEVPVLKSGGELQKVLCQPFSEGQSLFISTEASHSVSEIRGHVATIVLRDKVKHLAECTVLTKDPKLIGPSDSIVLIDDSDVRLKIFDNLCQALRNFKKSLLLQPLQDHYEINQHLENIVESTNKLLISDVLSKRKEYYLVGRVIAVVANWVNHDLVPDLRVQLAAMLYNLIGTREIPASPNDLVALVARSLSGRLLMIYRHLLFAISLYEQGYNGEIQAELVQVVQFPALNRDDDIYIRFQKTCSWFNTVLNNPTLN